MNSSRSFDSPAPSRAALSWTKAGSTASSATRNLQRESIALRRRRRVSPATILLEDCDAVVSSEPETVGERDLDPGAAGDVGDVVEPTFGVGELVIDRGGYDVVIYGKRGCDALDGACGAQQMAGQDRKSTRLNSSHVS